MAEIYSTTTGGNASDTATWAGGVKPVSTDTVRIVGPVTIDEDVTWGNGANPGIVVGGDATHATAGSLTLGTGKTLTLNGLLRIGNGNNANYNGTLTFGAGSTIAMGGSFSSAGWNIELNNCILRSNATSGNWAKVTGWGSIVNGAVGIPGPNCPKQDIVLSYVSFQHRGSTDVAWGGYGPITTNQIVLSHVSFYKNRTTTYIGSSATANVSSVFTLDYCDFWDCPKVGLGKTAAGTAPSGALRVKNCSFVSPQLDISSISRSGSTVTVVTTQIHTYVVGSKIRVTGTGTSLDTTYAAEDTVASIVDEYTFTFTDGASGDLSASTGKVSRTCELSLATRHGGDYQYNVHVGYIAMGSGYVWSGGHTMQDNLWAFWDESPFAVSQSFLVHKDTVPANIWRRNYLYSITYNFHGWSAVLGTVSSGIDQYYGNVLECESISGDGGDLISPNGLSMEFHDNLCIGQWNGVFVVGANRTCASEFEQWKNTFWFRGQQSDGSLFFQEGAYVWTFSSPNGPKMRGCLIGGSVQAHALAYGTDLSTQQHIPYTDYHLYNGVELERYRRVILDTAGGTVGSGIYDRQVTIPFVDSTRCLAAFSKRMGLDGTADAVLLAFGKINGFNTATGFQNDTVTPYTPADLVRWVREGFRPKTKIVMNAGDPLDGRPDVGAMPARVRSRRNTMYRIKEVNKYGCRRGSSQVVLV